MTAPPRLRALEVEAERSLVAESRAVLDAHARSFRIAALALGSAQADDAAVCYAFCRLADDIVDEADTPAAASEGILALEAEAHGRTHARPLVAQWLRLAIRLKIPVRAAWDLVAAVQTDLGPVRIRDDAALLRYAYGVAGTVGLMMCGVLGSRDRRAHPHAVDLGIGMQLTNICRDVAEDAAMDRIYLPAARLRAEGVTAASDPASMRDPAVVGIVGDLLALAEDYYESARDGLRYLPFRGKVTVLLALHLYRAIGRKVRRRGALALQDRTTLSSGARLGVSLLAVLELLHPRTWGLLPVRSAPNHQALSGLPGARSCPTA